MAASPTSPAIYERAWYGESIAAFLASSPESVIGKLVSKNEFNLLPTQRDAWLEQISLLHHQLVGLSGSVFLEYNIPRMGKRIDAVVISGPIVFVIEFKVGQLANDRAAIEQVWDYALDLKNFHKASHNAPIVPILIITGAVNSAQFELKADGDMVFRPISIDASNLREVIDEAVRSVATSAIDQNQWPLAPYYPTPTIIEAARALYAQHSVEAIARFDAGARNLAVTSNRVDEIMQDAKSRSRKAICFVTGVPGAGKTLVGLNIATQRHASDPISNAVFLSGNGPLVSVLREALTRDEVTRKKNQGEKVRKGIVGESVKAFIQNVHHFRDELLVDQRPPVEHVAIFDEAQRAWTLQQTANFMRRKKNTADFNQSEPDLLISGLDRHEDWAVVVCLVGGGQEINTGEAGIASWIESIHANFQHWDVHISSQLTDSEYDTGKALESIRERPNTFLDDSLHLSVSMRSFRAENVSGFVKAILDCDKPASLAAFRQFCNVYPIVISRNLAKAKQWILEHARGTERYGLVASSTAHRLKPDGVDIRIDVDPVHWFLNKKTDTRSSYYLEDAATEFQVQGLELDWACVAWDGDLRYGEQGWSHHFFRGERWCKISNLENQRYLCNAYRVLLTRARQGMVIYIPQGNDHDPTRCPTFYDSTYLYLADIGLPELK